MRENCVELKLQQVDGCHGDAFLLLLGNTILLLAIETSRPNRVKQLVQEPKSVLADIQDEGQPALLEQDRRGGRGRGAWARPNEGGLWATS